MDGSVNLWEMKSPGSSSLYIIEKIYEYKLDKNLSPEQCIEDPSKHVQSL
jgi:hypothetical protein